MCELFDKQEKTDVSKQQPMPSSTRGITEDGSFSQERLGVFLSLAKSQHIDEYSALLKENGEVFLCGKKKDNALAAPISK